jgi:TRAP-type C4-dicarboxylate transport system permease small subunit
MSTRKAGGAAWWLGAFPAKLLGALACLALFVMMVLTFVDVTGRYLLSKPLPAAYELVSFTMPVIIFCALPMVHLRDGHVTIDLLDSFVPSGLRRLQRVVMDLGSAAVMALVAWQLGARAQDHRRFDQVTDELFLPLWPFSAGMALVAAVAAVTLLVVAATRMTGRAGEEATQEPGL